MRSTMKLNRPALLFLTAALAAVPGLAERIERDYHESFDVRPGARLHLEHGDGDVTFTAWDQDVVDVVVRYRAEIRGVGASRRGEFEVELSQTGDTIRVVGREPSFAGVGVFNFQTDEYTYKVQAPAYLALDLEGDDGNVTVGGWRGVIEASLEDGDLHLTDVEAERFDLELEDGDAVIRNLTGDLVLRTADGDVDLQDCSTEKASVRTEDGDVTIQRCAGSFEIRSSDGSVELAAMRVGRVEIESEDGDVGLDLLDARSLDVVITTEDGTVDVATAVDLSAELDVSTGDGRIDVDLPGAELSRSRRRVTGRLGEGEGRIRITTEDGNVKVRKKG